MKKEVFCLCLLLFAAIILGNNVACCQEKKEEKQMKKKIDRIFTDFQNEKFFKEKGIIPESGWIMTLSSGKKVTRSFLMRQAAPIISYGREAVPYLFKWVMIEDLPIRYIAIYSLQKITGLSPYIPYFDKEDHAGNRENAIKIWKEWWKEQYKKSI